MKPTEQDLKEAADTLMNRVTLAIVRSGPLLQSQNEAEDQARAAIREVAAWLNERDTKAQAYDDENYFYPPTAGDAIDWLRDEINQ